ncbi:hypothetical protein JCM14469_03400 [Desulfatiferula olefinivorans]
MSTEKKAVKDLRVLSYIKGDLTPDQRAAFEREIESDEALRREVEEFSAIAKSYGSLAETLPSPRPETLAAIMRRIQTERPRARSIHGVIESLRRLVSRPGVAWSLSAAQFAVIVFLVFSHPEPSRYQTLSGSAPSVQRGITLNVVFHDTARQHAVTRLLNGIGATVVDGPTASGLYVIRIDDASLKDQILTQLREAPEVSFAGPRY